MLNKVLIDYKRNKMMKEKLNAFVADFKQETLLDAIRIKLSSNPALGITQSKVGGFFWFFR